MLEVSSAAVESQLDLDFGETYSNSDLNRYGWIMFQDLVIFKHGFLAYTLQISGGMENLLES